MKGVRKHMHTYKCIHIYAYNILREQNMPSWKCKIRKEQQRFLNFVLQKKPSISASIL